MAIKEYHKKLREFDRYLSQKGGHRGKVQTLVEFYRFLTKQFDRENWKFPFSRHLKAAQKILVWAKDDLGEAEGFVYDCWRHYRWKCLNWNLDTAYRNIPLLYEAESSRIEHAHNTLSEMEQLERDSAATVERMRCSDEGIRDEQEIQQRIEQIKQKYLRSLETGE